VTADEREVLIDLIRTVRTVSSHLLTLHLQLGAVRAVLAQKGLPCGGGACASAVHASIDQITFFGRDRRE
jgi:hypothetical protein